MITVLHGTFNKKDRTDDEFSRYKSFSAVLRVHTQRIQMLSHHLQLCSDIQKCMTFYLLPNRRIKFVKRPDNFIFCMYAQISA